MKVLITEKLLETGLICPTNKTRVEFCDIRIPGFYVEIRATSQGTGTFYLRFKDGSSKTRHQKIGRTMDISLKDAQKKAKDLRAEIQLGKDPQEEARARKAIPTLSQFATDQYIPYIEARKRSAGNDKSMLNLRILPEFGDRRLNQIGRHQIEKFHTGLLEEGLAPASCDHHIKVLRYLYNKAIDWDVCKDNPAARISLFLEDNKIERYLNEEELKRLLHVLATDSNRPVCHAVQFLLATGARKGEALAAEWKDIDQENRVWVIQATNSKSKRKRSVPLNDVALGILQEIDNEKNSPYVFVSAKTGKRLTTISKYWGKLRKEADLEGFRLHDLRHSFASFLVNAGCTLFDVQQVLGHSDPVITQRYSHLSKGRLQDAANAASDRINAALKANK
jgi:integrase